LTTTVEERLALFGSGIEVEPWLGSEAGSDRGRQPTDIFDGALRLTRLFRVKVVFVALTTAEDELDAATLFLVEVPFGEGGYARAGLTW
jgi:hypothetical protein